MKQGFTIIELLTVTAIIVVMTGLILPNWQAGKSQFALERSTSKLTQDIRRVQEMALAASEVKGRLPYGYGLHIDLSDPYTYFLYADFDNDDNLDWSGSLGCEDPGWTSGTDCKIETIQLERKVQLSNVGPTNTVTIAFAAPTPTVTIYPAPPANITLSTEARTKNICVNSLGLIELAEACAANTAPTAYACQVVDQPDGNGIVDAGQQTTFTLSDDATNPATDPDPGDSLIYWWNWGDGTPEEFCLNPSCNLNHTYNTANTYTISMYVKDDKGAQSGTVSCTPQITATSTAGNLSGYAWSENIGWINFCRDSANQPPQGGGHAACGELTATELRGWAYLEITGGWISLNCKDDPAGCASNYGVSYDSSTNKLSGYAWSEDIGWICFSSDTCGGVSFGVTLNTSTNEFEGWAWSENIGWISFNCANPGENPSACTDSGYKVKVAP